MSDPLYNALSVDDGVAIQFVQAVGFLVLAAVLWRADQTDKLQPTAEQSAHIGTYALPVDAKRPRLRVETNTIN